MELAYKECGLEMSYYNLRFVELVAARETQEAKQGQTPGTRLRVEQELNEPVNLSHVKLK